MWYFNISYRYMYANADEERQTQPKSQKPQSVVMATTLLYQGISKAIEVEICQYVAV
jgi:hypothetical protein